MENASEHGSVSMNAHKELHNDKLESLDSDSRYDVSVNSDISNNKLTKTPNVIQNIHRPPHNYFSQSSSMLR